MNENETFKQDTICFNLINSLCTNESRCDKPIKIYIKISVCNKLNKKGNNTLEVKICQINQFSKRKNYLFG